MSGRLPSRQHRVRSRHVSGVLRSGWTRHNVWSLRASLLRRADLRAQCRTFQSCLPLSGACVLLFVTWSARLAAWLPDCYLSIQRYRKTVRSSRRVSAERCPAALPWRTMETLLRGGQRHSPPRGTPRVRVTHRSDRAAMQRELVLRWL